MTACAGPARTASSARAGQAAARRAMVRIVRVMAAAPFGHGAAGDAGRPKGGPPRFARVSRAGRDGCDRARGSSPAASSAGAAAATSGKLPGGRFDRRHGKNEGSGSVARAACPFLAAERFARTVITASNDKYYKTSFAVLVKIR